MGRDTLISYLSPEELSYRLLTNDGSEIMYIVTNEDDIENLVDTILSSALQNTSANFNALPRTQQIRLAEIIATKKEKFIQLLKDHLFIGLDAW